jgi:hypothetical protein
VEGWRRMLLKGKRQTCIMNLKRLSLMVLIVSVFVVLVCFGKIIKAQSGNVYYASPTGGGDGLSSSSPFRISDFWAVAQPGDTLILLDGTYRGSDSMIEPPDYLSGTEGNPITIKALNDGKVLIDGEHVGNPVRLDYNDYFVLEGFNACCSKHSQSDSVVNIVRSNNSIVRRIVAWDASPYANNHVFGSHYGSDNLFEDCAGWGSARKIFSLYYDTRTTFRRCFFRWTNLNHSMFKLGMSMCYNSEETLIENCIGTWDELPGANQEQKSSVFGIDNSIGGQGNHRLFGSIGYHLSTQRGSPNRIFGLWYENIGSYTIKDCIGYTDRTDELNTFHLDDTDYFTVSYLTSIGGNGSDWRPSSLYVDNQIGTINNCIVQDSLRYGTNEGSNFDYIMYWNNTNHYQGSPPAHYAIENPNLTANGGNILQYGFNDSRRPKVDGQAVGTQIQYRYVDGVLTDEPLWPWPMNERIKEALVASGYDQRGGLDGKGGTDLTKVIFELGGGTMPDFDQRNCSELEGVDCCTGLEECYGTDLGPTSDCTGICCSQQCTTPTNKTDLLLLFHLDEGFGTTAVDSSGNGNNGTIYGANFTTESKIGDYALEFDGDNDYVEIGTNALNMGEGTIELWAKADSFKANPQYFFGHTTIPAYANRIQLYTDDTGGWFDLGLGDSHTRATNIEDLNVGSWYHIVLTWDGTNYNVFVNGVSKANGTYSGLSTLAPIADIGNEGNPSYRDSYSFNGTIDEVRIYNRPLTSEEVLEHYNEGVCHRADSNCDSCIETEELLAFIDRWKISSKDVPMPELMEAIGLWNQGTGC